MKSYIITNDVTFLMAGPVREISRAIIFYILRIQLKTSSIHTHISFVVSSVRSIASKTHLNTTYGIIALLLTIHDKEQPPFLIKSKEYSKVNKKNEYYDVNNLFPHKYQFASCFIERVHGDDMRKQQQLYAKDVAVVNVRR